MRFMNKIKILLGFLLVFFIGHGQGVSTFVGSSYGYLDAVGVLAKLSVPYGVCSDKSGNIYVADSRNHRIRKISPSGTVTTFAGSGVAGYIDGQGITANFNEPQGICCDPNGNIYVADYNNGRVRKITPSGYVSTYAGSGVSGGLDGVGINAQFNGLRGICSDNNGNIYVADFWSSIIRKINTNQVVTTIAGTYKSGLPIGGYVDGVGALAQFDKPWGICADPQGNLYVADNGNKKVRKITPSGVVTTYFSTEAKAICSDNKGNIYVSDDVVIKKINSSNQLTTVAGAVSGYKDGYGTSAYFQSVFGICFNSLGELFVADAYNNRIRKIIECNSTNIPIVNITSKNSICNGNLITLSASGAVSYLWNDGSITNPISVKPTITTDYSVIGTNIYGCQGVATKQVLVQPIITPSFTKIPPICQGINLVLPSTSSNGILGSWSPAPNSNTSTTYTFTPSADQCAVSSTMLVSVLTNPQVNITADGTTSTNLTINSGNVVQLQLNGSFGTPANIQWSPNIGISSTSIANPLVYPTSTTTYTASFLNTNGCQQSSSITVNVNTLPNIGNLSISSPNTSVGIFDTLTVNVQLNNAKDVYSLYMKLKGNSDVNQYLNYLGYTAGTLLGTSNIISTPPTVTNGVPDFGMTKVGAAPGYTGSGLFYSFRFVPKNNTIPSGTSFCFYLDDVNAYNSAATTCGITNQGQFCLNFTNQVKVWPGDLNNSKMVTTADLLPIGYFYNSTGPARQNATIQWTEQPATLWGYNHSSKNGDAYKVFADSNGDGIINNADQAAIGYNLNKKRKAIDKPFGINPPITHKKSRAVGVLNVTPNNSIINPKSLPQTITFNISLTNTGSLNSLYGISVNLIFNDTIFDLSTATIDYTGSIFGNIGTDCLAMNFNSSNGISVGLTRYANAPIYGQGLLFKITIQTKSTLPNLTQTKVMAYVDAANNQLGDELTIQDAPTTNLTINNNNNSLSIEELILEDISLYPNPTNDIIHLVFKNNVSEINNLKLKVFNSVGQLVDEKNIQNNTIDISTKNWGENGVYFVQLVNSKEQIIDTKKVIINKNL
jgi:streptogramin lyase